MIEMNYCSAVPNDEQEIKDLLLQCQLPAEDIASLLADFFVARSGGKLVGVVGLEVCGEYGLLRSLAVAPEFRSKGVSRTLHTHILARAHQHKLKELYLLTNTAAGYAERFGFRIISREKAPPSIQTTGEFKTICPSTSTCMVLSLSN
jgi:amino-acid N-acetyltransferase